MSLYDFLGSEQMLHAVEDSAHEILGSDDSGIREISAATEKSLDTAHPVLRQGCPLME
jgi:hypothetical protein